MTFNNLKFKYNNLIISLVKKYSFNSEMFNDLLVEAEMGLWYASKTYNPDKNTKFSTYAYSKIRYCILEYLKTLPKNEIFLNDNIDVSSYEHTQLLDKMILQDYINKLDNKTQFVINKKYFEGYNGKKIGDMLNMTKQNVSRINKKGIAQLRIMMT